MEAVQLTKTAVDRVLDNDERGFIEVRNVVPQSLKKFILDQYGFELIVYLRYGCSDNSVSLVFVPFKRGNFGIQYSFTHLMTDYIFDKSTLVEAPNNRVYSLADFSVYDHGNYLSAIQSTFWEDLVEDFSEVALQLFRTSPPEFSQ